jgi:hypothetical protein
MENTSPSVRRRERDMNPDKFRLGCKRAATGKIYYLVDELDRSIDEILWGPDSQSSIL